jgi:hypothetical protein
LDEILAGTLVRFSFALDVGVTPTDPETLSLVLESRGGDVLGPFLWTEAVPGPDISHDSTGRFHLDTAVEVVGVWDWHWQALDSEDEELAATNGTFRVVAGTMPTLEDFQNLFTTTLSEEALAEVIDGERAWLERKIGPLEGERTERFIFSWGSSTAVLRLQRRASPNGLVVMDRGTALEATAYEQRRRGFRIAPVVRHWVFPVEVTYTPNDRELVRRSFINLVQMAAALKEGSSAGLTQETIGSYSYTRAGGGAGSMAAIRAAAVADILEPAEPSSGVILSSVRTDIREHYIGPYLYP